MFEPENKRSECGKDFDANSDTVGAPYGQNFSEHFYHRRHKRLVAAEVKIGRFKAEYMGQMSLYLEWLNRYERKEGEEQPIGLILCTSVNRKKVEMLGRTCRLKKSLNGR